MKEITLSPKLPIIIKGKRQTASQIESCHFDEDTKKYNAGCVKERNTCILLPYEQSNFGAAQDNPLGPLLGQLPDNPQIGAL